MIIYCDHMSNLQTYYHFKLDFQKLTNIWVRSHVRFVRNQHGLLHFYLVTYQQEWSHGVHCSAVRPANQAKKLLQPRCQKLPQRPLRLKRDSPNTRYIFCYTIGFLGNGAVTAAPCDHPTLCGEICPQPHDAHVTVAYRRQVVNPRHQTLQGQSVIKPGTPL